MPAGEGVGGTLVLAPEVFGRIGGIQTLVRDHVEALRRSRPGEPLGVLVLNDSGSDVARGWPDLAARGFSRRRVRFSAAALAASRRQRPERTLLEHRNFLALAPLLRVAGGGERWVLLHGVDARPRLSALERLALRSVERVLAVSPHTGDAFRSAGHRGEVELWPCGLPHDWPLPEPRPARFEPPCRLLAVTRLDSRDGYKGVDHAIEALAALPAGAAVLDVAGGGDDLPRLRGLAERLGVRARVRFHGLVDRAALRSLYAACDVFVLPSGGEGFGIVFLEAMAFGKPVVAADAGGAPFVVRPGVSGYLVPFGSPGRLARCLRELLRDPEAARRRGLEARRFLERTFTFEALVRRTAELLAAPRRP